MTKSCILSNCQNQSNAAKLFKLPFKNPEKLAEWLEKIPKDLYVVIQNPAYICEHHFEKKFIRTGSGFKRLHPKAIPTIFNESKRKIPKASSKRLKCPKHNNSNCRFCLRKFLDDDKQVEINNYIRKQFFVITQTELKTSRVYSDQICETCFNSARDLATFRTKLLKNQKKLEETFKNLEDEGEDSESEADDKLLETSNQELNKKFSENCNKTEAVLVKVEPILDDNVVKTEPGNENEDFEFSIDWAEASHSPQSSEAEDLEILKKPERKLSPKKLSSKPIEFSKDQQKTVPPKLKVHKSLDKDNKKSMCEICGKNYSDPINYKRHYDRIHLKIKNFSCDVCGFRVFKKFELVGHLASHFKIRNHFCHLCPASFIARRALRQHWIKHKENRDFVCDFNDCKAAFKSKDTLKQHKMETHFKVCRYQCSECGKGFFRKSKMKRHLQTHFTPDPAQATPCPKCKKIFKNLKSMKSHMKNIHEEQKEFNCRYCGSRYSKNVHLNRHILVSHRKQKISCQVHGCFKTFPLHDRYRNHIKAHHKDLGGEKLKALLEEVKTAEVFYEFPEFELNSVIPKLFLLAAHCQHQKNFAAHSKQSLFSRGTL